MDDPSVAHGMYRGALSAHPVAGMAAKGDRRAGREASLNGLIVVAVVADRAAVRGRHGVVIGVRRLEVILDPGVAAIGVGTARGRRTMARTEGVADLATGREHLAQKGRVGRDRVGLAHAVEDRAAGGRGAAMSAPRYFTC